VDERFVKPPFLTFGKKMFDLFPARATTGNFSQCIGTGYAVMILDERPHTWI
jgi:hypothetical protein